MLIQAAMVYRFVRNDFDSEDIVQRAVLKAYTRLYQFRFDAIVRTWLISIALNEIRQSGRTKTNARLVFDGGKFVKSATGDPSASPFKLYEREEAAQKLRNAIRKLPLNTNWRLRCSS